MPSRELRAAGSVTAVQKVGQLFQTLLAFLFVFAGRLAAGPAHCGVCDYGNAGSSISAFNALAPPHFEEHVPTRLRGLHHR
jgi:hypothetical protein